MIDETNRKLRQNFKREHKYKLQPYEEQLYKEVLYDGRPKNMMDEEVNRRNLLKK